MGKDSPQAKDSTKGKEQARGTDHTTDAEPTNNSGVADAARDAWSGISRWGRKAADKVGETSTKVYHEAKDAVQSDKGQAVIKKSREGAAKAIETVGGRSDNKTVNEVTKNVKLIPGAGTVVNAAEALTKSGVTGKVRDGKGRVNTEVLIRGAVETAPITGDAARLKNLADRTGVTGTVVDKVQEQVRKSQNPGAHPETQLRGGVKVTVNPDTLIRGAVESAPVSGDAARVKALSDNTGFTGRFVDRIKQQFKKAPTESSPETQPTNPPPTQIQERQKVKR